MLLSLCIMHNPGITITYIFICITFLLYLNNSLLGNTWMKYWETKENGAWKSLPAFGMEVESDSGIDIDYRFFFDFSAFFDLILRLCLNFFRYWDSMFRFWFRCLIWTFQCLSYRHPIGHKESSVDENFLIDYVENRA